MIVKDEEAIIERCLDSAAPLINGLFIVDTGSLDQTIKKIEGWSHRNSHVKVHVQRSVFVNFAVNRTECLENASNVFPNCKANLFLLMDADMILCFDAANKSVICNYLMTHIDENDVSVAFHLQQRTSTLAYNNTRLITNDDSWQYKGVTHEYVCSNNPNQRTIIVDPKLLSIKDIGDGGCKSDKFTRDIKLLSTALKEDKNETLRPRYLFYLARSYMDVGNYDKAEATFLERIKCINGWDQERFFSYMQLCEIQNRKANFIKVLQYANNAIKISPQRAEPWYYIVRFYNQNGLHELSVALMSYILTICESHEKIAAQYLFSNVTLLRYYLPMELAVASYYTVQRDRFYKRLIDEIRVKVAEDKKNNIEISAEFVQLLQRNEKFV